MFAPETDLVKVWNQTKAVVDQRPKGLSVVMRMRQPIEPLTVRKNLEKMGSSYLNEYKVRVYQEDCVDVAQRLMADGHRVLLHNMASWTTPGGGVAVGCPAQEEELFRRSDYARFLQEKDYPFATYDMIFSPDVEFFRAGAGQGYAALEQPFKVGCVAAPALAIPALTANRRDFANEADRDVMRNKIRHLFWVATNFKYDTIVLSAWGCGAFECPAPAVATLFKEVIQEFRYRFKEIAFAVLGPNFNVFHPVLDGLP
jgi:uncharacterized protein (TIGR02452 family)